MAEKGFVSNRVFDALACGAFVVSDHVAGMEKLFDDIVPTYRTAEELADLIERYSQDPEKRTSLIQRGIRLVHGNHSFDARADQFVSIISARLQRRRAGIEPETGTLAPAAESRFGGVDNAAGSGVTTIRPT